MKFGRIVLLVNTHRLTELDLLFDVTLSRRRQWHHFRQKMLPPGEWQKVYATIQQRPPVPDL